MTETKKATKKTAAKKPVKKATPQEELQKAIDTARKAGVEVRAYSVCQGADGESYGKEH